MLISRNWLQSYFEKELPDAQKIADILMLHAFEIEDVKQQGDDWVIDVDVLPNRAHDCLSHIGFVRELSALLNIPYTTPEFPELIMNLDAISVDIQNPDQCMRYQATRINNVQVGSSQAWLQDYLSAMGQRSINNLVDITNVILFDIGQPMHVFDAHKIVGGITVRNATPGETMTTLTGEELELIETDLVIADDEGILALAGIKGGTKAEVDEHTRDIIIESANFNPTTTRATARRVKILTDASKRYENGISSEKVSIASKEMIMMIKGNASSDHTQVVGSVDRYPLPKKQETISVTLDHIQSLLGFEINKQDVSDILHRCQYHYTVENNVFMITVPFDRLDLRIAEDMIEEIGRMYGYHNIPAKNLDDYSFTPRVHPLTYVSQKLRNLFISLGYTELMTYSFLNKGDVEVYNPMASDKKALRKNVSQLMLLAAEKNIRNSDYFGIEVLRIFEIGRVYTANGEETMCTVLVSNTNKKARKMYGNEEEQLKDIHTKIEEVFACNIDGELKDNTLTFSLDTLAEQCEVPDSYGDVFAMQSYALDAQFHQISPYPYVKRDISLWVDTHADLETIRKIINDSQTKYFQKIFLFDEFEKDNQKSFAFSLIFQSHEKTLDEKDIEADMTAITQNLEKAGCVMR